VDGGSVTLEAGIVGRDPDRLERFYVDVMGFTVVHRIRFDEFGSVVRFARGDARFKCYFPAGAAIVPPDSEGSWFRAGGFRYAALNLATAEEVDALVGAMAAAGGTVLIAPSEHRPGARMALVTDPEHNPWELLCG
jgi:catechol 2,3-dioxygenase-like lactoylglutathione lyase family enzyme